jgi:hypothetical protein
MPTIAPTYRERLDADRRWALWEGSMHFDKESAVFRSLQKITSRLDEIGVPYALAGGMALFQHGHRRFTEDVDLLVTRDGLKRIHDALSGLGYIPPHQGSKNLRDVETGVRIEFLIAGDYPGDGKPKPVSFPNPETVTDMIDGLKCLSLPSLVELKLASGTAAWRIKDLGDVQELIRVLNLPLEFDAKLDPFVRDSYRAQWNAVHSAPVED